MDHQALVVLIGAGVILAGAISWAWYALRMIKKHKAGWVNKEKGSEKEVEKK